MDEPGRDARNSVLPEQPQHTPITATPSSPTSSVDRGLAQAIQRNFFEKGSDRLWWYSRYRNQYEERTPYGIAHGRHTYTFSAIRGDERYALELAFSQVEDKAAPAFKKLEASQDLTQAEHNAVAEFVGFQFLRTPSKIALLQKIRDAGGVHVVREYAKHLDQMTEEEYATYMARHEKKTGKTMTLSREELVESLKTRPPKVTSTKEGTLDSLVDLGTALGIEYSGRSWVVLHAPRDSSFITSSEGVFLASDGAKSIQPLGPGAPGVATVFPFSRTAALIIEGSGPITVRHARTNKATVRSVNDSLAGVSGEIYGSPRRLLESIVKRTNLATTDFEIRIDEDRLSEAFSKLLERNAGAAFPSRD